MFVLVLLCICRSFCSCCILSMLPVSSRVYMRESDRQRAILCVLTSNTQALERVVLMAGDQRHTTPSSPACGLLQMRIHTGRSARPTAQGLTEYPSQHSGGIFILNVL